MRLRNRRTIILSIVVLVLVSGIITRQLARDTRELVGPSLHTLSYDAVTFHNVAENLRLRGLLFLPAETGSFPGVVIVHGSGSSRRDNPWYLILADYLQRGGVAVLLPDKRGSEQSEGDWRSASFDDLAGDATAAIAFLAEESGLQLSSIGLIGMSQGGQIAPIAANRSDQVDFIISVSGSAVPLKAQLRYEENHNLRQIGVPPGLSNLLSYPAAWSIVYLRQREFWTSIGNPDALPHWRQVEAPSLIIYGAEDTNVPVSRSVRRLRSLEQDNIAVEVFPGSGHAIQTPRSKGDKIIREEALSRIHQFILNVDSGTRQGRD